MVGLGWTPSPQSSRAMSAAEDDGLPSCNPADGALLLGRLCAHVPLKQLSHAQLPWESCPGPSTTNSGRDTTGVPSTKYEQLRSHVDVRPSSQAKAPSICDAPPCDELRPRLRLGSSQSHPYRACASNTSRLSASRPAHCSIPKKLPQPHPTAGRGCVECITDPTKDVPPATANGAYLGNASNMRNV
ncbi:hypothetical protein HDV57DRAFT_247787 [Trichoderma longibrachiatum]|uniref:Uncharacterized protein n=1 Tax=Trichoderma longibrachiatum ATCC 18648 TaxID=983965 RepID=A0A2T4C9Q4_TRILO|nr:hypothetical protein M440DRAFT_1189928 [Trichoderma longibrachiatum ATCC 18648]